MNPEIFSGYSGTMWGLGGGTGTWYGITGGIWFIIIAISFLVGSLAGYVGSYTGLGGGMIIRPIMGTVFDANLGPGFLTGQSKVISLSSNMGVFMNGAMSTPTYVKHKDVYNPNWFLAGMMTLGLILGQWGGTQVENILVGGDDWLKWTLDFLWTIFLFLVVVLLTQKHKIPALKWPHKSKAHLGLAGWLVGILMGFIAGLFGVGGGAIKLPFILIFFGVSVKQAAMYSLILGLVSAPLKMISSSLYLGGVVGPVSGTFQWFAWAPHDKGNDLTQVQQAQHLVLGWTAALAATPGLMVFAKKGSEAQKKATDEQVQKALVFVVIFFGVLGLIGNIGEMFDLAMGAPETNSILSNVSSWLVDAAKSI